MNPADNKGGNQTVCGHHFCIFVPSSEDGVEWVGMPLPTPAPYFSRRAPLDSFGDIGVCGRLYDDLETTGSAFGLETLLYPCP